MSSHSTTDEAENPAGDGLLEVPTGVRSGREKIQAERKRTEWEKRPPASNQREDVGLSEHFSTAEATPFKTPPREAVKRHG
eukprot:131149-Rhodomonas_salina.2